MSNKHWEQNKDATVYVGNLDERFGEAMMWELMTQMGPVMNVHMPMDRVSRTHQGYGFVEFNTPESADYAARVLNGVRIFGKPIRVNKASADRQRGGAEIGAELFVNNLDPQVDEKILYDTFSSFGTLVNAPSVIRDANNISKGYGFVSFDSFEASDAARDTMTGQYVLSKQITVEYAYKKDGKGERHGDEAERKLASEGKKHNIVPEAQPLPPAFLMTGPRPGTDGPAVPTAAADGGAGPIPSPGPGLGLGGPSGPGGAKPPPSFPEMNGPNGSHMPPVRVPALVPAGFGGPGGGPPLRAPPPQFGGIPSGPGGHGRGNTNLPPPPTGLPARPPPSHVPYNRPAGDFHPGSAPPFRLGGPPGAPQHMVPGQPGGIPPGFGAPPPPGFAGGMGGPPPAMPPGVPGGFMPPPGFGTPGNQPPAGFARR